MTNLSLQIDDKLYQQVIAYSYSQNVNINEFTTKLYQQFLEKLQEVDDLAMPVNRLVLTDDDTKIINQALETANEPNAELSKLLQQGASLV